MYLKKLFEAQKILRDRIGYNGTNRFNKLILALLVESGECANEWRGFKFWSVNQLPHTSAVRVPAMMDEDKEFYNPLLEEYVDKLHFILELGLEIGIDDIDLWDLDSPQYQDITTQFLKFYQVVTDFWEDRSKFEYKVLFERFLGLGVMLGFSWEQIEQSYFEKNKINHTRQETGY